MYLRVSPPADTTSHHQMNLEPGRVYRGPNFEMDPARAFGGGLVAAASAIAAAASRGEDPTEALARLNAAPPEEFEVIATPGFRMCKFGVDAGHYCSKCEFDEHGFGATQVTCADCKPCTNQLCVAEVCEMCTPTTPCEQTGPWLCQSRAKPPAHCNARCPKDDLPHLYQG